MPRSVGGSFDDSTGYTNVLVGTFEFQYSGDDLPSGSSTSLDAAPLDKIGTNYHWFSVNGGALAGVPGSAVGVGNAVTITVFAITGTDGDDVIRIVRNSGDPSLANVSITTGGAATAAYSIPLAAIPHWTVAGLGGADRLEVDFSGGNPLPAEGLTYDGGASEVNTLAVKGLGGDAAMTVTGAEVLFSGAGLPTIQYGNASVSLDGVNGYSGGTTVTGGTLHVEKATALPIGTNLVIDGGTVSLVAGLGQAIELGGLSISIPAPVPTPPPSTVKSSSTLRVESSVESQNTDLSLRTGESITVALSPFAPRKSRSFAERKATLVSSPVLTSSHAAVISTLESRATSVVAGRPAAATAKASAHDAVLARRPAKSLKPACAETQLPWLAGLRDRLTRRPARPARPARDAAVDQVLAALWR